jgi:hypothetical protein
MGCATLLPVPAGCAATIGELDACAADLTELQRSWIAAAPSCEQLECATFPATTDAYRDAVRVLAVAPTSCVELSPDCLMAPTTIDLAPMPDAAPLACE